MTANVSGTDAKEIAIHFIETTTQRATPAIMKKTIIQAKSLLKNGYTKNEILKVIDYLVKEKHVDMYSLGYVNIAINNVLREIKRKTKQTKSTSSLTPIQMHVERNEVKVNDDSAKRNKTKLNKFGIQSRFRKKYSFNMFEKQ